jgi:hypothetical protein
MGIRTEMSSKTGTIFSEDVLKIEICGPHEDYLTIIDVPGIFRNHTEGITTKEDINLVNNLVRRYIKDKRTIILAVLPSNVDIATQEIIALAEEYDRLGERTLGVLTKPDLVTESNAKNSVCNLVSGKRMPLSLGYYIVRNRGADDGNKVEHNALEKMFQEEPWSALPSERVGIFALKKQLEALLAQITRREFPSLRKEVSEKLAECQKDLDTLGPARPTEKEQRGYLSAIARNFEGLTREALSAQYSHDRFFEKPETRLITLLVNLTGVFSDSFRQNGQIRHFKDIGSITPLSKAELSAAETFTFAPFEFHAYLRECFEEYGDINIDDYPELGGIVTEQIEIEEPQDGVMEWIKELYLQSRGVDLGTFSPDLLSVAFVEQSRQWEQMVRVYMGEVVRLIHHFMAKALRAVCADDDITKEIWSAIIDPVLERYKAGLEQGLLLVDIERYQRPFTLNRSFNEEVQVARGKRTKEMLRPKAWRNSKQYDEDKMVIHLDDVPHATTAKTNEQHLEEEIHDKLYSYYHLAVDRFMDNIFRQAVSYHLLYGPLSPLNIFSQGWVIDLDTEKLELMVGEKEATKRRRQILTKKRKDLKVALEILKA